MSGQYGLKIYGRMAYQMLVYKEFMTWWNTSGLLALKFSNDPEKFTLESYTLSGGYPHLLARECRVCL